jgi:ribonuclease VapC
VAIALGEREVDDLLEKLMAASAIGLGTPSLAEAGVVLSARLGRDPRGILARLIQELGIVPIPFGDEHWKEAIEAYRRYGKGGHRAALNFGDCLAYATAKLAAQPLLCTGTDFSRTDLPLA